MFGAPFGASTSLGKSFTESCVVMPMRPPKGCSGRGRTSWAGAGNANVTDRPNAISARRMCVLSYDDPTSDVMEHPPCNVEASRRESPSCRSPGLSNVRPACYRSALRIVIDLHLLASAIALARHGNYAHAADALHLSQPALSRQIAALESSLGVRLFDRGRKGAEPTAFGRLLLERAEPLLSDATDLERAIRLMQGLEAGDVSVGAGLYPAELSLGSAIGRLVSRHPGLRVDVTVADWRQLIDGVLGKRFDLAVAELAGMTRNPRLALEPFPRHAGVFFCRAGHPLLDDRVLTLRRVLAFPLVGPRMPARVHRLIARHVKGGTVDRETGDYVPPIKTEGVSVAKSVAASSDAIGLAPLALITAEIEAGALAPTAAPPSVAAHELRRDPLERPRALAGRAGVRGRADGRGSRGDPGRAGAPGAPAQRAARLGVSTELQQRPHGRRRLTERLLSRAGGRSRPARCGRSRSHAPRRPSSTSGSGSACGCSGGCAAGGRATPA